MSRVSKRKMVSQYPPGNHECPSYIRRIIHILGTNTRASWTSQIWEYHENNWQVKEGTKNYMACRYFLVPLDMRLEDDEDRRNKFILSERCARSTIHNPAFNESSNVDAGFGFPPINMLAAIISCDRACASFRFLVSKYKVDRPPRLCLVYCWRNEE
eukprot:scaffold17426_cov58-Attheya_sp.AAC.1